MNDNGLRHFYQDVATLLQKLLQKEAEVTYDNRKITVIISREIFEHRFGVLLHRMQLAIDEQFLARINDLSILVTDAAGRFEHLFKIWKTSETRL